MSPLVRNLPRLLALLLASAPGLAGTFGALVDAPGRNDFEACYLTTEDPLQANLATLRRGLKVQVIGRAANGRWRVALLDLRDPRVILHGDWPGAGQPVGYVNPEFLVFPGASPGQTSGVGGPSTGAGGVLSGIFGVPRGVAGSRPPAAPSGPATGLAPLSPTGLPTAAMAGLPTGGGLTGSAFLQQTQGLAPAAREQAIETAVLGGNVPSFLAGFVELTLEAAGPSGARHTARVRVAPDYLAIGTDADFVRIPMTPATAQRIADQVGCTLPRPKLVDAIWQAAEYKLRPRPLTPGPQMGSNAYYQRANRLVDEELAGRPLGRLTAGDKKDIVLTNRLGSRPGQVAIYGWHRTSGSAIQPLSLVHGRTYVDYSHGLRLVANDLEVDGRPMTMSAALADPELAPLLSRENPVTVTRYP